MSYRIRVSRRVAKQIEKIPPRDRTRVDTAILRLEEDPRPPDVEKLTGANNVWRIRVGSFRIVYTVDDPSESVEILRVAHRRDVYRRH
jgi:mRNA interferase RelE/StbE